MEGVIKVAENNNNNNSNKSDVARKATSSKQHLRNQIKWNISKFIIVVINKILEKIIAIHFTL